MSSPCDCQEKDSARMELSETGCALHQRLSVVAYLVPVPSPCVRVPDLYICFWIQIILSLGREHNSYLKNSYFENWTFWTANGISSSFLWLHAIVNLVKAYMVFTVSDLLIFLHFFHSLWVNKKSRNCIWTNMDLVIYYNSVYTFFWKPETRKHLVSFPSWPIKFLKEILNTVQHVLRGSICYLPFSRLLWMFPIVDKQK